MKNKLVVCYALILFNLFICSNAFGQARLTINLNDQWKFRLGTITGAEMPGYDDSAWDNITLPHTWNNLDGQDGNVYQRNSGWYRKKLFVPTAYQGKKLFLRFGAANLVTTVYINGIEIGTHRGGYAAFIFDITSTVNYNATNTISVKVDNTNTDLIAPISADFTFCGGLTRAVELLVTGPVNISPVDYASPGIYITQDNVTAAAAKFSVKVLVNNYTGSNHTITKTINIKDANNNIIPADNETLNLAANTKNSITRSFTINNPVLWNGRLNPHLYKVEVILKENNLVIDSLSQPLGLRFFSVSAQAGFYLNGNQYPLYGVNMHEDRLDKGRAISDGDRLEDINILKELGVSFIRLSHYQHAKYTYDLADKNGIILWTEIPLINRINNSSLFTANIKEQLIELIRQNYNHPSVFFWGLYNEILNESGPDPLSLLKELNTLAHQEDATRLTTVASNTDNNDINKVADLASFNKYYGWYSGTPVDFDTWLSSMKSNPLSRPVGLSEYGAGASIKHHELNPAMPNVTSDWHPEELENNFHEQYWKSIQKNPFLWQTSAWVAFDFSSDGRMEGDRMGINDKGLVTQDRKTKKDAFYFYKAHWSKDKVLYITSRRFSERTDALTYVKAYSNCDSVKLQINEHSFGSRKPDDNVFLWENIVLMPGVNIIRTTGYKNKEVVKDSCIWRYDALKADKTIRINFQTNTTITPAGYLADIGLPFGSRGNGLSYGWNVDNTVNAREKNSWSDKLYDTYNHFQKNTPANFWEIALKKGSYLVQIASGDPAFFDSNYKILAEGKVILNGKGTPEVPWVVDEDTVKVIDGRLTVRAAADAVNAKINFIHITRVDSANLGLKRKVKQSSIAYGGNPEKAIDGNTDGRYSNGSIILTNNELNAWWEIDLGDIYPISTIQIWNRTDCCKDRLSNFYIIVSNVPFVSQQLGATLNQSGIWKTLQPNYPDPSGTYAVNRTGRYVRIQLAGTGEINMAEVIIMGKMKLAPVPPSELKITDSSSGIHLQWNDNSDNEQGFYLERKKNNANFEQIGIISADIKTYVDQNDLTPGSLLTYRIKAYSSAGSSDYSNEISVTLPPAAGTENVALHKPATQSSIAYGGGPERAVDGNTDGLWNDGSVIHTNNDLNAWWEVDLGAVYTISTIELWNRTNSCCVARLSNYYVFVSDVPFVSKQLNATLSQSGIWHALATDYPNPESGFSVNRTGRYVRVQLMGTAELNIAEVIVKGSSQAPPPQLTNLARNKAATQSSTNYGGTPDRAVDGNTNGLWENGSVTHTYSDLNAWWEVDLGSVYPIGTINVWNRTNSCCMDRLSNFHLFVSDVPFVSKQLTATLNQSGIWHVLTPGYPNPEDVLLVNRTGRYVRVQLPGTSELNIAEVEVMGASSQAPPDDLVDLARNKSVTQSSTIYGGVPEKAVDGNTDGLWENGSVTHTFSDLNAWWEVDLGDIYTINTIELWNRTNSCCMARLSNFHIFVSDVAFQSKILNTTLSQPGVMHILTSDYPNPEDIFTINRTGRYIRVQLSGTAELNIAELKAMGPGNGAVLKSSETDTDIPVPESMQILMYPMPFSDVIMINSNQIMSTIELLNVLGEELLFIKCDNTSAELNTSSFKPGLYFIRVTSAQNKAETYRAIKIDR